MTKNTYRRLLSDLHRLLGPEWRKHGPSLLLRDDGAHLIQGISCQTSNFDKSYVVAIAVQVLAKPADSFNLVLGGRVQRGTGGDLWLHGDKVATSEEIRSLLAQQSWPSINEPLTVAAVARELDARPCKSDPHYLWAAGVVYGLAERPADAQRCFNAAKSLLTKLRNEWERSRTPIAEWLPTALEELGGLAERVQSRDRFLVHCEKRSLETRRLLRLD